MIPDVEALVGTYLREDEAVSEITDRVGGRTPRETSDPWIRITQITDEKISRPLAFMRVELQLDIYGPEDRATAHETASTLARTVRESLDAMPETQFDDAVVSAVTFGPLSRVPDSDFEPPRERFVLTARVHVHE